MRSLWRPSLRSSFRLLRSSPLAVLLIQIPAASTEVAQLLIEGITRGNQWIAAAILIPYLLVMTTLSSGGTFLFIRHPSSLAELFTRLWKNFPRLFAAGLIAGIVGCLATVAFLGPALVVASQIVAEWKATGFHPLSFLALLVILILAALPGIYYCTIYFFVSMEVLRDPAAPILACFTRSKRLAREHLIRTALAFICLGLISMIVYGVETAIGDLLALGVSGTLPKLIARTSCITICELFFRALSDAWVSYYYINRKQMTEPSGAT